MSPVILSAAMLVGSQTVDSQEPPLSPEVQKILSHIPKMTRGELLDVLGRSEFIIRDKAHQELSQRARNEIQSTNKPLSWKPMLNPERVSDTHWKVQLDPDTCLVRPFETEQIRRLQQLGNEAQGEENIARWSGTRLGKFPKKPQTYGDMYRFLEETAGHQLAVRDYWKVADYVPFARSPEEFEGRELWEVVRALGPHTHAGLIMGNVEEGVMQLRLTPKLKNVVTASNGALFGSLSTNEEWISSGWLDCRAEPSLTIQHIRLMAGMAKTSLGRSVPVTNGEVPCGWDMLPSPRNHVLFVDIPKRTFQNETASIELDVYCNASENYRIEIKDVHAPETFTVEGHVFTCRGIAKEKTEAGNWKIILDVEEQYMGNRNPGLRCIAYDAQGNVMQKLAGQTTHQVEECIFGPQEPARIVYIIPGKKSVPVIRKLQFENVILPPKAQAKPYHGPTS